MTTDTQIKTEKLLVDSLFQNSIRNSKIPSVKNEKIQKLTGDASSRRYYRISSPENSYVVCLQQPSETDRDSFLEIQRILKGCQITVPEIYDYDLKKGYILEEDLGDRTLLKLLSGLKNQEEELLAYKGALEEMIKIHSIDVSLHKEAPFSKLAFDEEKLYSEVLFTIKHLIEGLFGQTLKDSQEKIITSKFKEVCKSLSSQKMVLTHRDFHSRNLMCKNEKLIVIDFQDARMGIPQYDLVSLLEDCYYKLSRQNKHKLKVQYWDEFLKPTGFQSSYDEFCDLYDQMAIQRVFKALGSFAYIYRLRGDIRYLKYIGYAFEKLRYILFRHESFRELRVCLSEIYYEY